MHTKCRKKKYLATEEKLISEAKKSYLEYIQKDREDATIDDVSLFEYLGIYNNSLVGIFMDKKNSFFTEYVVNCFIEDLDFSYSNGYQILVYSNSEFYPLQFAYKNILTYDDLKTIYNIHNKID